MKQSNYKAIAELIRVRNNLPTYSQRVKYLAPELADYFEKENPKFKRELFLKQCGCEVEE